MGEDTTTTERETSDETAKVVKKGVVDEEQVQQSESSAYPQDNYSRLAKSLRKIHSAISEYSNHIYGLATISALVLAVLDTFYTAQLQALVPALVTGMIAVMTSNATIVTLLLVVILLQIYQIRARRVDRQDSEEVRTDGGSDLPPRDSQGRFTSESSGPDLLMVLLAALAGFTAGSQFGETEALIGAFLGIAVITYLGE